MQVFHSDFYRTRQTVSRTSSAFLNRPVSFTQGLTGAGSDVFQKSQPMPSQLRFSGKSPSDKAQATQTYKPISIEQRTQAVALLQGGQHSKKEIARLTKISDSTVSEIEKQLDFFTPEDVIARNVKPTDEHIQQVINRLNAGEQPQDIHKSSPLTLREVKKLAINPEALIRQGANSSRTENMIIESPERCDRLISDAINLALPQARKTRFGRPTITLPYDEIAEQTSFTPQKIYEQAIRMQEIITSESKRTDFPNILPPS